MHDCILTWHDINLRIINQLNSKVLTIHLINHWLCKIWSLVYLTVSISRILAAPIAPAVFLCLLPAAPPPQHGQQGSGHKQHKMGSARNKKVAKPVKIPAKIAVSSWLNPPIAGAVAWTMGTVSILSTVAGKL